MLVHHLNKYNVLTVISEACDICILFMRLHSNTLFLHSTTPSLCHLQLRPHDLRWAWKRFVTYIHVNESAHNDGKDYKGLRDSMLRRYQS